MKVNDKVNVLNDYAHGVRQMEICKKYKISAGMFSKILQDELKIRQAAGQIEKRTFRTLHSSLDQALLHWFWKSQQGKVHINGSALLEQAKELAKQLEEDFIPTRSWIQRWCRRNHICLSKLRYESTTCSDIESNDEIDLAALNSAEPELIECHVELSDYETDAYPMHITCPFETEEFNINSDEGIDSLVNLGLRQNSNAPITCDKVLEIAKMKNVSNQKQITDYFKKY